MPSCFSIVAAGHCALLVALLPTATWAQVQPAPSAQTLNLDTPGFSVRIELRCKEGEVTCENVTYRGKSKKTGKSVVLTGKTAHTLCADKVTPCRFIGYVFKTGTFTYLVTEQGELIVRNGQNAIVSESGTWQ